MDSDSTPTILTSRWLLSVRPLVNMDLVAPKKKSLFINSQAFSDYLFQNGCTLPKIGADCCQDISVT